MSEIGIKDQCFGVEVEMTGITREQAAHALGTILEQWLFIQAAFMIRGLCVITREKNGS